MLKPATKTSELIKKLNQLHSRYTVDDLTLARLQREAEQLLKVEPFEAYQILGSLARFKGNKDEVKQYYEKALKLAITNEDKVRALGHYATSVGMMGYYSEAVELTLKVNSIFPYNKIYIENSINFFTRAGLFHRANQIIIQNKIDDYPDISRIVSFMDRYGVTDEALQQVIETAISVLHAHQFFSFPDIRSGFSSDEATEWFCYEIGVECSVEEFVEMEDELSHRLVELDLPLELELYFIVMYRIMAEPNGSH